MFDVIGDNTNLVLAIDSYHRMQAQQMNPLATKGYSVMAARKALPGTSTITVLGNMFVAKVLQDYIITKDDVEEAAFEAVQQGYEFDFNTWYPLVGKRMPVIFRGVLDGTELPIKVPLCSVESAEGYAALAGDIEAWAQDIIWLMSTAATKNRERRKLLNSFCVKTGVPTDVAEYMLHYFGDRSAGGQDAVKMTAIAHAIFFSGSDCMRVNKSIRAIYGDTNSFTSSCDATEHRTMCSNSNMAERDDRPAFDMSLDMLDRAVARAARGVGIPVAAAVVDTYDDERYIKEFLPSARDRIANSGGKYLARVDSGDAVQKPIDAIGWAKEAFAGDMTKTSTGHDALPAWLSILQGDGLRDADLNAIVQACLDNNIAASSIGFGMGSGASRDLDRGELNFSMKGTAQFINGEWVKMQKAPKSDKGKTSHAGRVEAYYHDESDTIYAQDIDNIDDHSAMYCDELFVELSHYDGSGVEWTFEQVRELARKSL